MGRRETSILLAVALIVAVALSATAGAAGARRHESLERSWGKGGGGASAGRLRSGRRRPGPPGAGAPGGSACLVGSRWRFGRFSYRRSRYRQCTEPGERLRAGSVPLIANSLQNGGRAGGELSAVGMVFAPAARRVRLTFADGSEATIALRRGRVAGLRRFRYAAFLVRGIWCAERVVSEAASGRTLWDSGVDQYRCLDSPRLLPSP